MKLYILACLIVLSGCGSSNTDEETSSIAIQGVADIQREIDIQGDNFVISLEPKTYLFSSAIQLRDFQNGTIDGNGATFKRVSSDKISTTLDRDYNGSMVVFVDELPESFSIGDKLVLISGETINDITLDPRTITAITGNAITVHSPFNGNWHQGDTIAKTFRFINSVSSAVPGSKNGGTTIKNIKFDGNARNNQLNFSWRFNGTISLYGGKDSTIINCEFFDIPNDCIIGHGFNVINCSFDGLNASVVHMSVHDNTKSINAGASFIGNDVYDVNRKRSEVNGHSEGAITFSWGGGNLLVRNNRFTTLNGEDGVMGKFYSDTVNTDENLVFEDNEAIGFRRIILLAEIGTTVLNNVTIRNNTFIDCGNTYVPQLRSTTIDFSGNTYINTTINI